MLYHLAAQTGQRKQAPEIRIDLQHTSGRHRLLGQKAKTTAVYINHSSLDDAPLFLLLLRFGCGGHGEKTKVETHLQAKKIPLLDTLQLLGVPEEDADGLRHGVEDLGPKTVLGIPLAPEAHLEPVSGFQTTEALFVLA